MYKILIIAGEPSGDILGAKLMKEMKLQFQNILRINESSKNELLFQGIGGSMMQNEGLISLFKMEDLSIMGFFEIFGSLQRIYSIINRLSKYAISWKPDLIITIDSPDFCFRLVKKVRKVDKFVPIIHYVAPSVWAWRPKRAKKMAIYYDKVLSLLPFEKPYFEKYGLSCDFVGHPIMYEKLPNNYQKEKFLQYMKIDTTKKIITLLPGSRISEIKYMLPIYTKLIKKLGSQYNDIEFILPTTKNVDQHIKSEIAKYNLNVKILSEVDLSIDEFISFKLSLFLMSTLPINTSGSVSLELARTGTPMISIYKCSWFFEKILKIYVKTGSANLINILIDKKVVPEFLFENCKVINIENSVKELLNEKSKLKEQKDAFKATINTLLTSEMNPSEKAAYIVLGYLKEEILKI